MKGQAFHGPTILSLHEAKAQSIRKHPCLTHEANPVPRNACLTPGHPQCGRSTEAVSQALGPGLLQTASDRGCHPAPQLPGHLLSQSTYHCFEEKELKVNI